MIASWSHFCGCKTEQMAERLHSGWSNWMFSNLTQLFCSNQNINAQMHVSNTSFQPVLVHWFLNQSHHSHWLLIQSLDLNPQSVPTVPFQQTCTCVITLAEGRMTCWTNYLSLCSGCFCYYVHRSPASMLFGWHCFPSLARSTSVTIHFRHHVCGPPTSMLFG